MSLSPSWSHLIACLVLAYTPALLAGGDPDYTLSLGDGVAALGEETTITVGMDFANGEPVLAYSFSVCNDGLVSIEAGDVVDGTALDGHELLINALQFFDDEGWTVGTVFSPIVDDKLLPANGLELYEATYSALFEGTSDIEFCTLGDPPVLVTVLAEDSGELVPSVRNGTIESGGEPPFALAAAEITGSQGNEVQVPVTLDCPREADAVTFGLSHDASLLTLLDIEVGTGLGGLNDGDGPDYFFANTNPDGILDGGTLACVASLDAPLDSIEVADDVEIAVFTYEVAGGAADGSIAPLEFTGSLGSPPVKVVVSVGGFSETPTRNSGEVLIEGNPLPVFVRGDPNADGRVDISDPFFLARFLFVSGAAAPICSVSGDADANSSLSVADAIYLLQFLFEGEAEPAAPFPDCGVDSDESDDLICEETHNSTCP